MRLSLSAFLFEDDRNAMTIEFGRFVELARSVGCDAVELRHSQANPGTPRESVQRCKALLDEAGLFVAALNPRHVPPEGRERDRYFDAYLDVAVALGARLIKISGTPEWLRGAATRAMERGIVLAVNTHVQAVTETIQGALGLARQVDHPNFGILHDAVHLKVAGEDEVRAVDELYPFIRGVLVQCLRPARPNEQAVFSYHGRDYARTVMDETPVQDWPAIVRALKGRGYDGWIGIVENGWLPERRAEVALRTVRHIRRLWNEA